MDIPQRIVSAIAAIPNLWTWLYSANLLLIFALISLPIGFYLGFLKIDLLNVSWKKAIQIGAICLLTPAITEELFFRVLLLPHPAENPPIANQWLWGCISLIIFVIYHPLNALTFYPAGRKTFLDPVFLFLATLLGAICTLVYFQSGSLLPIVIIHWLIVVVWLLLLGGYQKLNA